jgi:phosphotransferase system HPr (HPr) family protein
MPELELTVNHAAGLHARPAAEFTKLAAKFPCTIKVCNLDGAGQLVNAKSILSVLTLGVNQGHHIRVEAEGPQADQALAAIHDLVVSNFGESAP